MLEQKIDYSDEGKTLEAFVAYPSANGKPLPAILVFHAWAGKDAFACQKARDLAQLGYIGIAADMYGKGILGRTREENIQLMSPWMENRLILQKRVQAALRMAQNLPEVQNNKIAAIGYCFGGLCALDLARSGATVKGVVSFHGLLNSPKGLLKTQIQAKILALHGHEDPMVTPQHLLEFETEMTEAKADWQVHVYGKTLHAFTNPQAQDPEFGTVYEKRADQRSWIAMKNFFTEIFSEE